MTEHTFNADLLDAMLAHQIGILRFSGGVRNKVWRLLDATEADIKRNIKAFAAGAGFGNLTELRRLDRLLEKVREIRITAWKKVTKQWIEDARALALSEPDFLDRIIKGAFPVALATVLPPPAVLRKIVTSQPFMGKTLLEWAKDIRRADLARIESQIKIGLVQGESPSQISRRVVGTVSLKGKDGVTQITRRNADSITRTVLSGIASEARDAYLRANSDLAPDKLFTATLDSRTTPICQRFDGKLFRVEDLNAPVLPLHFGERSIYSPVIDGEIIGDRPRRDFTDRQLLREYTRENGLSSVTKRKSLPRGHKGAYDAFARKRMRELTGRTPAKTTYSEFLKRQSAANQDDILGPTRGKLFRKGGLTLDKFVEVNGREITLSELADRHPSAFTKANLDPAKF